MAYKQAGRDNEPKTVFGFGFGISLSLFFRTTVFGSRLCVYRVRVRFCCSFIPHAGNILAGGKPELTKMRVRLGRDA